VQPDRIYVDHGLTQSAGVSSHHHFGDETKQAGCAAVT
jgi:hypothetical protein